MIPGYITNYLTYQYSVIPSTVTFLNINQDVEKEKSDSFVNTLRRYSNFIIIFIKLRI